MTFDLNRGWRLSPAVALRPEPFGALAYHFGNRRLSFLRQRRGPGHRKLRDGAAGDG